MKTYALGHLDSYLGQDQKAFLRMLKPLVCVPANGLKKETSTFFEIYAPGLIKILQSHLDHLAFTENGKKKLEECSINYYRNNNTSIHFGEADVVRLKKIENKVEKEQEIDYASQLYSLPRAPTHLPLNVETKCGAANPEEMNALKMELEKAKQNEVFLSVQLQKAKEQIASLEFTTQILQSDGLELKKVADASSKTKISEFNKLTEDAHKSKEEILKLRKENENLFNQVEEIKKYNSIMAQKLIAQTTRQTTQTTDLQKVNHNEKFNLYPTFPSLSNVPTEEVKILINNDEKEDEETSKDDDEDEAETDDDEDIPQDQNVKNDKKTSQPANFFTSYVSPLLWGKKDTDDDTSDSETKNETKSDNKSAAKGVCEGTNANKKPCQAQASPNSKYCKRHVPILKCGATTKTTGKPCQVKVTAVGAKCWRHK
jgi:hypothetical protein